MSIDFRRNRGRTLGVQRVDTCFIAKITVDFMYICHLKSNEIDHMQLVRVQLVYTLLICILGRFELVELVGFYLKGSMIYVGRTICELTSFSRDFNGFGICVHALYGEFSR